MRAWVSASISGAVAAGALIAWVASVAGDQADTRRRVDTVEKRQAEDRAEAKVNLTEVKGDVKTIAADVQTILQKVTAMEAVQRAERFEKRGR